ncbi:box C/D snoRNA protein 1 isoform X2 [Pseudophryne corroboree]|uniref:box C/D snoRNA protein 1 isoform X2 n=1 Tax=Pseudophryne corroboree TaxID=495146 RepID=UPI003081DB8F
MEVAVPSPDPGECPVTVQPKRKMSLYSCETCGGEEARYKCPGCMKYSCSLPCVKKHKAAVACSGVRDKTAFVPLSKFSDIDLLSDYRFLEDAGRVVDRTSRDGLLPQDPKRKSLSYLRNRARKRHVDLKSLPFGFSKKRENSTHFNKKEQKFYWHLKLLFPQCQAEYAEKRVPEDKTIGDILKKYIDPAASDPTIRQRLKAYVRAPSDVKVFVVGERTTPGQNRSCELDSSKTLRETLRNKTIIEYPTLCVTVQGTTTDAVPEKQECDPPPSAV